MENQPDLSFTTRTDDEIDLRQVFGALRRRKALIAKITLQLFYFQGYTLSLESRLGRPIRDRSGKCSVAFIASQLAASKQPKIWPT